MINHSEKFLTHENILNKWEDEKISVSLLNQVPQLLESVLVASKNISLSWLHPIYIYTEYTQKFLILDENMYTNISV